MPLTPGIVWTVGEHTGTTPLVGALQVTGKPQHEESLVANRTTLTTAGASLWEVLGGSGSLTGLLNLVVLVAGVWLTATARSTVHGRRGPEPA